MKRTIALSICVLFLVGTVGLFSMAMYMTWRAGKLWIVLAVWGGAGVFFWAFREFMEGDRK